MSSLIDAIATGLIRRAARQAPADLAERLEEEWLADLSERPGLSKRLSFAVGCCWAAAVIERDGIGQSVAVAAPAIAQDAAVLAPLRAALVRRRFATGLRSAPMCEINTTPLIDVMLVLLITLIVSLPIMTHAVKLDLPQSPAPPGPPPEVINLDIDFDGTVLWNDRAIAGSQQLESYLRAAARKVPQPEVHLRPDPRVKYDVVAKVLAAAQRNRLQRVGFVNTSRFGS
jgi:biopolymer transport protein ExbD